ncbi:hypothetical protein J0S82_015220, partial [Galemys pyrenaicus]
CVRASLAIWGWQVPRSAVLAENSTDLNIVFSPRVKCQMTNPLIVGIACSTHSCETRADMQVPRASFVDEELTVTNVCFKLVNHMVEYDPTHHGKYMTCCCMLNRGGCGSERHHNQAYHPACMMVPNWN